MYLPIEIIAIIVSFFTRAVDIGICAHVDKHWQSAVKYFVQMHTSEFLKYGYKRRPRALLIADRYRYDLDWFYIHYAKQRMYDVMRVRFHPQWVDIIIKGINMTKENLRAELEEMLGINVIKVGFITYFRHINIHIDNCKIQVGRHHVEVIPKMDGTSIHSDYNDHFNKNLKYFGIDIEPEEFIKKLHIVYDKYLTMAP